MGKCWKWFASIWRFIIHWKIVHPGQVILPSPSWDKRPWAGLPPSVVHFTTIRYSLIQLVFPCVVLGWMPIAASHVSVKWHPSIAECCSALRESPINHEEQSLKLSGWIKESWTCFASNSCWHFYRLRQRWMQTVAVGGEEQTETQEERANWVPGRCLEWAYFSMSCWVRGIFLFFMQDPMSSQRLFSYKRVKQELSCLKANQFNWTGWVHTRLLRLARACWNTVHATVFQLRIMF